MIGDNYNKVYENKLITIIGGDKSKLGKARLLGKTSKKDGIIVTKFLESQIIKTRYDKPGCFSDKSGAEGKFERDGDRRATIKLITFLAPIGPIGDGHDTFVTLRVFGYKKGWFGWRLYKTLLAADDVSFSVKDHEGTNHIVNNFFKTQYSKSKNLYQYWNFGNVVIPDNNTLTPEFNWLVGRGVTRGTGDDGWAVICCDYWSSSCPDNTGSDPFP